VSWVTSRARLSRLRLVIDHDAARQQRLAAISVRRYGFGDWPRLRVPGWSAAWLDHDNRGPCGPAV